MKSKPIPHAVYSDPWLRAQAKLQTYTGEEARQLEQLGEGLSTEGRKIVEHIEAHQLVVREVPPIHAVNLPHLPPLTGLKLSYVDLSFRELGALALHPETYVRAFLATTLGPERRHEDASRILAKDAAHIVRRTLASNIFICSGALSLLARDNDVWVRRRVAYHARVPSWLARKLLQDPDEDVRVIAAMSINRRTA